MIRSLFAIALLAGLTKDITQAATYTWDGADADLKSAHWLPGAVTWPGQDHAIIVNGGVVRVTDSNVTYRPQTLTITNATVRVTGGGRLFPGTDATSRVITINSGGVLELDTWFKADTQSLGRLIPDAARLVINGGTLRMRGTTGYGRGATVNAGGATLEAAAGADWLLNNLTDDIAWIYNGNPTLTFSGAGEGRFDKVISSGCSVVKRGPGKWTLARSNTYTGSTTVEQGILTLRRAVLPDTGTVTIADGGVLSLRHEDGDVVGTLVINGVTLPAGEYSKATHPRYLAGSGSLIVGGPATAGTGPLTWFYGGGGDAGIQATLTNSMNAAVARYNDYGYFRRNVRAEYNAGVPTAQAGYNGPITFGGSRNTRVALHEFGHVFGAGTRGEWGGNLAGGVWQGAHTRKLIQQIDGPGTTINSDGTHFWPYGLNFDNEDSARNQICHVRIMEALNKDMGLFEGASTITGITDRTIAMNTNTGALAFTIGDPSAAVASLVVVANSTNTTLFPSGSLVVGGAGAARTVTATPAANQAGTAYITLSVSGGREAVMEGFLLTVGTYNWNGGAGTWDTTTPNWNGVATTWPEGGTNNDALFAAAGGTINLGGTMTIDDATFSANGYTITGGQLDLRNTATFTIADGISTEIASPLVGDAGVFTKDGPGTLVLSGTSGFVPGITAAAGTLHISGNVEGSGLFTIASGATLTGAGSLPTTDVLSGGTLSPGPASGEPAYANVSCEGLILHTTTNVTLDLGLAKADTITCTGDVTLKGTLNLRLQERPLNGYTTLMTYTGTLTGTMALGTLPAGYTMALDTSLPGVVRLNVISGGYGALELVPAGSSWQYLSNVSLIPPAQNWSHLGIALPWATAPARFAYGETGAATTISTTAGKPLTAYFKKSFTIAASDFPNINLLAMQLLRDDGAVVYLNGHEVRRDNFIANGQPVLHNQLADAVVADAEESQYVLTTLDPGWLHTGENVIAVQVHQVEAASSDLSFDLRLQAALGGGDTDNDGLNDAWELRWFSSLAAQSATSDADNDGNDNATEMKARSSPIDPSQAFRIRSIASTTNTTVTLTWQSTLGVPYHFRSSPDCQNWTPIGTTRIGNGSLMTVELPLQNSTGPEFFQAYVE